MVINPGTPKWKPFYFLTYWAQCKNYWISPIDFSNLSYKEKNFDSNMGENPHIS